MIQNKSGIIVNISSAASKDEYYNPIFRMSMSCIDRMTRATAFDLKPHNVSVVSIWPRWVRTERVLIANKSDIPGFDVTPSDLSISDTPEFTGRAIAHLASDPDIISRTGLVFPVVELAHDYNFSDIDGNRPYIDEYTREWIKKLHDIQCILDN
jgi:NAD(P)-dependent dehydrogenase (short-subunit alcohol dehydrogenase family)